MTVHSLKEFLEPDRSRALTDSQARRILSDVNHLSFRRLASQLKHAQEASGREPSEVAQILGVTEELLRQIFDDEYELTTGELQELAYAIDAVVDVRVHVRATATIERSWIMHVASQSTGHWKEIYSDTDDTFEGTPWRLIRKSEIHRAEATK